MQLALRKTFIFAFLISGFVSAKAQTIPRDELVFLTSEWKGERFADGRPKIPDELLQRAKNITIEEAWLVLKNEGYYCQFEGNWKTTHNVTVMTGRAVTAMYIPSRPDIEKNIKERGKKAGRTGNTNAWPIETLVTGDVYVADAFGKIDGGTLIGDNLANAIYTRSGNGVIFNSAARDPEGIAAIPGFQAWIRDWDPSYLEDVILTGLNTPIRIGRAIVLPGDLVLAKEEGVIFIPAHLAQKVIITAEFLSLRDKFAIAVLKEGRFTTGEIDNQWSDKIKDAFLQWLDKNQSTLPMKRSELDAFMKNRTW
ncbi:MAG TPA: RraA family protein [Ohtaekwangia sp.]|uniref:RraA family protein n=1 Tax=Ohtaekwangia sp. TaxID=2066019 RepID=UPI002F922B5A